MSGTSTPRDRFSSGQLGDLDQWIIDLHDKDRAEVESACLLAVLASRGVAHVSSAVARMDVAIRQRQAELDEMLEWVLNLPDEAVDAIDHPGDMGALRRFQLIAHHRGIEARQ